MQRFEDEIRQALGRPAPPPGFLARVEARLGPTRPATARLRAWHRLAAAAVLLVAVLGGVRYWQFQRAEARRRADAARLVWALDLTGHKVRAIERTLAEKRWAKLFLTPERR